MPKRNSKPSVGTDSGAIEPDKLPDDGNPDGGSGKIDGLDFSTVTVDPTTFATDAAGDAEPQPIRRGRGRPPGSGTKTKAKALPLNINGLEKLLIGIHGGLAILSGRSEWSLDTDQKSFDGKTEAEFLARSIKDVADFYGGGLLDDKTLAWLNLGQCLAMVYGGRLIAIKMSPKPKPPPRQPSAAETARAHNPAPPPMVQRTMPPPNNFEGHDDTPPTHGHIAGLGDIELPADHPLNPMRRMN